MLSIGRVGVWSGSGRTLKSTASNPIAQRIALACGVVAGGYACRGEVGGGAAALARAFDSTSSLLYADDSDCTAWAGPNPHAVVKNMFRYPPKLVRAIQRIADDGRYDLSVGALMNNHQESEWALEEAWKRVASPGERLAIVWETTAYDGGKATKIIDMEPPQYARCILVLCCYINERLNADLRAGVVPDVARADSLPEGDYDQVGATSFAPIREGE